MQAANIEVANELLCINTNKVYDWVINEATFDLNLTDVDLPELDGVQLECDDVESVSCEVEPTEYEVLNRTDRPFVIDGAQIILQQVVIQKTFDVTIFATTTTGTVVEIGTYPFTRSEQVVLCAPEGTTVTVDYSEVDCFVSMFNCVDTTADLGITVRLCQSIQATFPVTIEVMADFCEPREDISPVVSCPEPIRPPQCPVLFP